MINRKIRKNTGFERISGRPVRASSPIFGLDVLRFEVNRVFLLEKPNKDAVIPKEYTIVLTVMAVAQKKNGVLGFTRGSGGVSPELLGRQGAPESVVPAWPV